MKELKFVLMVLFVASVSGFGLLQIENGTTPDKDIRIGINPWPGYEFLYLAEQKGFFKEEGLNVRMVQFSSLQDVRQAFERGQIDGMCSTLVETVHAYINARKPSQVVLVTDYSNGSDVILAKEAIKTPADLKGKKVAAEPLSLGVVVLARALNKNGLKMTDVEILHIAQTDMEKFVSTQIY